MRSTGAEPASEPGHRPPVFLCGTADLARDVVVLGGSEGRHAATVRRLGPGERVDLSDGAGLMAKCVVTASRPGSLELSVRSRQAHPRPDPAVVVVQALPKGDRGQLAVELMTEAGVDVVVPWAAQRCVARWEGERGARWEQRWQATAREAAKQARRAWLPDVRPLVDGPGLLQLVAQARLAVLLDPAGNLSLAHLPLPAAGDIVAVVGPEGGVTPEETTALEGAGAVRARLGPTVLRTSSAGVVAAAVLLSRTGRWEPSPA